MIISANAHHIETEQLGKNIYISIYTYIYIFVCRSFGNKTCYTPAKLVAQLTYINMEVMLLMTPFYFAPRNSCATYKTEENVQHSIMLEGRKNITQSLDSTITQILSCNIKDPTRFILLVEQHSY